MAAIAKIISALAAILPALVAWWAKRQAAREQAEAAARVADIRREPADAWVRKFNAAGEQRNDSAGKAGPDQPDSNTGGRNHDG